MLKKLIQKNRLLFFSTVAAGIIRSILALLVAYFVSWMAELVMGQRQEEWNFFVLLCVLYYISYLIFYYCSKKLQLCLLKNWREQLKNKIFHALLFLEDLQGQPVAKEGGLAKLTSQVDLLEENYYKELLAMIYHAVTFLVTTLVLSVINGWMTAVTLGILGLYFFLSRKINKKLADIQLAYAKSLEEEAASLQELVYGYPLIRQYHAAKQFGEKHKMRVKKVHHASMRYAVTFSLLSLFNNHIRPFLSVLVLILGALLVHNQIVTLTLAGILAWMQLVESLVTPIATLGTSFSKHKSAKALQLEQEELFQGAERGEAEWQSTQESVLDGALILSKVSFSYGEKMIFKNLNLVLEKGKG